MVYLIMINRMHQMGLFSAFVIYLCLLVHICYVFFYCHPPLPLFSFAPPLIHFPFTAPSLRSVSARAPYIFCRICGGLRPRAASAPGLSRSLSFLLPALTCSSSLSCSLLIRFVSLLSFVPPAFWKYNFFILSQILFLSLSSSLHFQSIPICISHSHPLPPSLPPPSLAIPLSCSSPFLSSFLSRFNTLILP